MKITESQLLRAYPQTDKKRVGEFVRVFNEWSSRFGIDTKARVVHFLAQVWHESGALRYTEEIASGQAYEWRADLGNTQKGDGRRFKGRGLLQLTGRANYQAYARSGFCTGNLMSRPELLSQSPGHTKSAMWFWWKSGLNQAADQDNGIANGENVARSITRRINGGQNGIAQRLFFYRRFKREFGLAAVLAAVIMLSACRTQYVPVETVRTEYLTHQVHDSVRISDSTVIREKGDTVWLERWHTSYRDRWCTDTVIRTDTLQVPCPVERKLTRWEAFCIDYGKVTLGASVALVLFVIVWLVRAFKKE